MTNLIRAIGVWGLAATIFNCTVGGGIFRLPGMVYAQVGSWTPVVYIICGVVILLVGLCLASVGRETLRTGGPYAYTAQVFGPYVGLLAGVLVWLLGTLAMASVATAFVASLGRLLPSIDGAVLRNSLLIITACLVTFINVRGVAQGTRLVLGVSVIKLLPLLALVLLGLPWISAQSIAINQPFAAGSLARACMLMIFAYTGVECALSPSGEVADPKKTVPRAIFFGLSGVVILYLAIQLVAQAVLGSDLALAIETPLADVAEKLFGAGGRTVLLLGASVSMFGYLSAMTLSTPRGLFALASDGLLPKQLANVHREFATPVVAIVVQSLVVLILALTSSFEALAIISNLAGVLLYLLCISAAWVLAWRRKTTDRWRLSVVPVLALLANIWLLSSITIKEWTLCLGMLALASMAYWIKLRKA